MIQTLSSCQNQDAELRPKTIQMKSYEGKTSQFNNHRNLYFGDLHIHTGWSFDAYMSEVRVTPDEAYLFGKGKAMPHVSGDSVTMNRPLDFMAVSDHAEYMGALMQMGQEGSPFYDLEEAKDIRSSDPKVVKKAFRKFQFSIATNWPNKKLIQKKDLQYTWKQMVDAADRHYEPGTFTTFAAYEWTSSPAVFRSLVFGPRFAQNLHRNVIFKGGKVSALPFSSFSSQNPEDLWHWMDLQRKEGIELLAIPHNANISDGRMYAPHTYKGKKLTSSYAKTRMRNEPISEVVQIKGQSMTHPILSPNDEFADFEVYQFALGQGDPRKILEPNGGFVRQAFRTGLELKRAIGENPFQFGVIGSSDSHNGGSNVEENNNIGKSGIKDPTPEIRMSKDVGGTRNRKSSVAGLAAVWAKENTREAIFEALERKEVYATSGSRIRVRFFASFDWNSLDLTSEHWDSIAYEHGVPMGNALTLLSDNREPEFIASAIKDPEGANLDRIQVIKGWIDKDGQSHEKIFNVAWSNDRTIMEDGRLKPITNTVDSTKASYTNQYGAVSLSAKWKDPQFNPEYESFYYLRVLEVPTPRWSTFDALSLGTNLPDDVPYSIQERAWSSPIWLIPKIN